MYSIKGLQDTLFRNYPSLMSKKDQAKFKILKGDLIDKKSFTDKCFQDSSYLVFDENRRGFEFNYQAPEICLRREYNEYEIKSASHISKKYICYYGDTVKSSYEKFVSYIDSEISKSLSHAELLYEDTTRGLKVYITNLPFDPISCAYSRTVLGIQDDIVVFIFSIDDSYLKGTFSVQEVKVKGVSDGLEFNFRVENDILIHCLLKGEHFELQAKVEFLKE